MITYSYKSGYIHDNFTDGIIKIQIAGRIEHVKSIHAAKCLITRIEKGLS